MTVPRVIRIVILLRLDTLYVESRRRVTVQVLAFLRVHHDTSRAQEEGDTDPFLPFLFEEKPQKRHIYVYLVNASQVSEDRPV